MSEKVFERSEPTNGKLCQVRVWSGSYTRGARDCGKKAKIVESGKAYCGIHDPLRDRKRNEAYRIKSDAKYAAWKEKSRRDHAIAAFFDGVSTEEIEAMVKAK